MGLKLYGLEVNYKVHPPRASGEHPKSDTIASKQLYFAYEQAEELMESVTTETRERLATIFPKESQFSVSVKVATYMI